MKYHFKIRKETLGFSAQGIELDGCFTQGDSWEELEKNMQDALNVMVQEPENSKYLAPLPDESIKCSKTVVEVELDPTVAFSFMVRYNRIKSGITQKQAAKILGFDNIYSYQRLENKKCNPTLKVINGIKKLFPDFSLDYALSC